MGRRSAGVVACLVSCLRIEEASSIYLFRCLRLGSDLGCQSLCLFWIKLIVRILPICRDLEISRIAIFEVMTCILGDV